jgi:hypothetical protein
VSGLSLRDRFFTPRVARAIVSPSAILATGAGVAVGILTGRDLTGGDIDPFALGDPWRRLVRDALAARAQFWDAIRSARSGPLRDRLSDIGRRIDDGVRECWEVAKAGQALAQARRRIVVPEIERELASLGEPTTPTGQETLAALRAQLEAAQRMDQTIADTHDRLRLLNARLDEAVTRSIELSVSAANEGQIQQVGRDVTTITHEMEALRQALEITSGEDPTSLGGTTT